ncbi:Ig-like domain-containing protein [Mobilitalea sibirica]|uniref:Ig-like domain-containing protein n=2 Tax=Mobilitalea sibirica TaxID=1462919 RepID=A0A8J7H4C8_9FIRM|nr:Ig-like domain-containing protein [Mobilitalea sibirica]
MVAVTFIVFTSVSCSKSNHTTANNVVRPTFVQKEDKELQVGETFTLEIENMPTDANYQWSSSDSSIAMVDQNGLVKAVAVGSATITCDITRVGEIDALTVKVLVDEVTPKPTSEQEKVSVDQNGFDSSGRSVAYFGSPSIDGEIDEVWNYAQAVVPKYISDQVDTTATFKALWDDNALYILSEVKDKELSTQSETPYMQDSFEIFLDENNDKTQEYGVDDLHFRVNYENSKTIDNGDGERFYTSSKKLDGGYIIETRVSLKAAPTNGKVLGIEFQINDAIGTNRIGTINVFDSTGSAWNDTSKFGEILLTGKPKDAVTGLNPYDLLSLIDNTKQLDLTRFQNESIVTDAIHAAKEVLNGNLDNQKQIDEQYALLKEAIGKLKLTEEAAKEKDFVALPDEYKAESQFQGTIESLEYEAANLNNGTDVKKLNVYLPYGYDASDTSTKYNVLYLMHGGGENENLLFGGPGQSKELKRILDNMITKGDIEPLIVVTPTFYGGKNDTALFHEELMNDVVPLVETKYHTYAESADLEDLKASRDHRAFGGFSMGSVTTWYIYINCLDYFKYYLPLSGDCWAIAQTAGESRAMETAEYLAKVAKDAGYGPKDYYLFCATGSADIAYPNMVPQIEAMKKLKDTFIYSSDTNKGNFYFIVSESGTHAWNWVNQYIYDILPDLFKN